MDRGVAVIILVGRGPTTAAAKAATATIPIVFNTGEDAVKTGSVAALNRPGGNATGISLLTVAMEAKRLQLLHELVPTAAVVARELGFNEGQNLIAESRGPFLATIELMLTAGFGCCAWDRSGVASGRWCKRQRSNYDPIAR